ncbi:MAG: GNAT family N-acetyltransferase [Caldilineaceae bacterium]|nr:GNAT family N-acetyltransferase [Caldilineaceae bacterium]
MVIYRDECEGVREEDVDGLFGYWGRGPAAVDVLRIFRGSDYVVLAVDDTSGQVIGYITAISDGVSAAYIPHLEVRPAWQGQGIGTALVRRMLARLRHLYMIDLMCDDDLRPFYERLGFRAWTGMLIRHYDRQACD